jgi:dihydrofolate reductase
MSAFKAIAAMSKNRVIGRDKEIPWHIPEDFKWFKATTMGQVLVMGRRTFESVGKALPGRQTLVLTRGDFSHPEVTVIQSLDEIAPHLKGRECFIAGGAQVYAEALPRCSDLFLTHVLREVEGDVLFPPFEDRFEEVAVLREEAEFRIVHYRNRDLK